MGERRAGRDPRGRIGWRPAMLAASLGWALAAGAASAASAPAPPGTETVTGTAGGMPAESGDSGGQSLGSKATDPTAGLTSLTFTEVWNVDYHDADRGGYALRFRPALPFKLWGLPNIMRVSLQFDHGGRPGYGLEDVQVFDLLVFPALGGRIGVGPLVNLASDGSATPSPFAAGPAVGYVFSSKLLNLGGFSQNFFGDDVGASSLQPVATIQLGHGLDLGAGDLQFAYDWEAGTWVSVPLGAQLGYLATIAKQPLRLFAAYQYNFRELAGTPRNALQFGAVLLVP